MIKIGLVILLVISFCFNFSAQSVSTSGETNESSKQPIKLVLGINFGLSTLDRKVAFGTELTYGVKYKKHFFGMNYSMFENSFVKENTKDWSLNYINLGYLQQYSLYQQDKKEFSVLAGVSYAEFGIKDLNTVSFFHTGNMFFTDKYLSLTPGLSYSFGIFNLTAQYRFSIGLNSSNVSSSQMTDGVIAMVGFKFDMDTKNK
jgi:hypothetical protein